MSGGQEYFPVSEVQRRILVLSDVIPGDSMFTIAFAGLIGTRIEPVALSAAAGDLARRHHIVNAFFMLVHGEYRQQLSPSLGSTFRCVECSDRADVVRILRECAAEPFDPEAGQLLRIVAVQASDGVSGVLVSAHRLIADETSLELLVRELFEAYSRNVEKVDQLSNISPPDRRFVEYAVARRDDADSVELRADLRHWSESLGGVPDLLTLPTYAGRPLVRTSRLGEVTVQLAPEVLAQLCGFGFKCGTTLEGVLLAAYQCLLSRLSGLSDIVVGVYDETARTPARATAVGPFADLLPVITRLADDPPLSTLVRRTAESLKAAREHGRVPLGSILSELDIGQDLSHDPLFQAQFRFIPAGAREGCFEISGAAVEPISLDLDNARSDLALVASMVEDRLELRLEYRTDLFTESMVRLWADNLTTLCESLPAEHAVPVSRARLLSSAQRREVLETLNATQTDVRDVLAHELVAEWAERTPGRSAVGCGDREFEYGELELRASRLSRHLVARGVGRGTVVGLCLHRSLAMPVAVLAVLKTGAAYVPLDPEHPAQRIEFMVKDSAARMVVTCEELRERLGSTSVALTLVDELGAVVGEPAAPSPDEGEPFGSPVARPSDPAYIIYTSGSTGQPKGVLIEHGSLANLALAQGPEFGVTEMDRVLQFASFSFDVSVSDMFFTWAAGGFLQIATEQERLGDALHERLSRSRISKVTLPPAAVATLPWSPGTLPDLRTLFIGGEPFTADLVAPWAQDRLVVDAYGPTESTVWTTMARLEIGMPPVIGKPLANMRVYVLDRWMQPVPTMVPGELYVAGVGLARGYINQPDLTAQRFIDDPFGPPGSRLYRTGDVVRMHPDGTIEFAGRTDDQVKVRGFRIELGEVEEALRGHRDIRQAVVTAPRDQPAGGARLVAYIRLAQSATIADDVLRDWLLQRLPRYMVPEAFIRVPEFQTTRAGKIDRQKLPKPPVSRPELSTEFVSPSTRLERALAEGWMQILGLNSVGVHDDFFSLGGNSVRLLAVRSWLSEAQTIDIRLSDLFRYPTISSLAALLERTGARPPVPTASPQPELRSLT